jgi:hypothetical protein
MEFIDGVARDEYPNDMVFEEEKLLEITPDDIARHFKNLAYGTSTPGPNDEQLSTILWKKLPFTFSA